MTKGFNTYSVQYHGLLYSICPVRTTWYYKRKSSMTVRVCVRIMNRSGTPKKMYFLEQVYSTAYTVHCSNFKSVKPVKAPLKACYELI